MIKRKPARGRLNGAVRSVNGAVHYGGTFAKPRLVEQPQLRLSSTTGIDGSQVVSVAGELDIATAEQAYLYLSEALDHGRAPISVDLSGLTFCDASGLSVLARAARKAREAHRQIMLTSVRPSLLKIMRITGLDSLFPEVCSPAAIR